STHHHGARPLGRSHHHPRRADRRRGHADPRGGVARGRQRDHPPDHFDPDAPAHRADAGPVHPGGERDLAHARGVDAAGLHDRRAGAGDSGVHRRRTHRLGRIHVRRQLRAYRAHPPHRSDGAPPRLMDGRMTPREQTVLLAAASLYAVVAIVTGIRGGGDLEIHFPEAALWLARQPLYAAAPRVGAWWPPFAVVGVVPFALLAHASVALAKAAWAGLARARRGGRRGRGPDGPGRSALRPERRAQRLAGLVGAKRSVVSELPRQQPVGRGARVPAARRLARRGTGRSRVHRARARGPAARARDRRRLRGSGDGDLARGAALARRLGALLRARISGVADGARAAIVALGAAGRRPRHVGSAHRLVALAARRAVRPLAVHLGSAALARGIGLRAGARRRTRGHVSLSPRERRWLIGVGVLYAAVVIPIGIRKGGDFTQELTQGER